MKKALLIGINYTGTDAALSGCINDALAVKEMLMAEYNYLEENIVLLTDDSEKTPTRNNILIEMINLISESRYCEEIWIHYSGHGSFVPDYNNDEIDEHDEVLIPVDYVYNGFIVDDLIRVILNQLDEKCRCMILFDCCHSGTLADLPYIYRSDKEELSGGAVANQDRPIKADIMMISGCRDEETSADALLQNKWAGAMTHYFLKVLKDSDYSLTFGSLLTQMRQQLKDNGFEQYPVLSSAQSVNLHRHFSLRQEGEPLIK